MTKVYVIGERGKTEEITPIRCSDEYRELHLILENNLDLIPGDQVDPEDPRRWMLVRREMPVPDPNTGSNRWSIDFLLGDQDAIPTFVECKRFKDTRSRREVVGQVLEYAANGHYYWNSGTLQQYAESTAEKKGRTLEETLLGIQATSDDSVDIYFDRMEENLREGQVRIVFYFEEAPLELKSVVDFLNRQMERSEVLLVEVRQFKYGDLKILVPTVFGYTEQARQVKRTVTVSTANSRRRWNKETFLGDAVSRLSEVQLRTISDVLEKALAIGYQVSWGTGAKVGSFTLKDPTIEGGSVISVYSNGTLSFNFGTLKGTTVVESLRERMRDMVVERLQFELPEDYAERWPNFKIEKWSSKVDSLVQILSDLLADLQKLGT